MDKAVLSDSLTLTVVRAGEKPPEDAVFFASAQGASVYIEAEPAAFRRLAARIIEKFPCD